MPMFVTLQYDMVETEMLMCSVSRLESGKVEEAMEIAPSEVLLMPVDVLTDVVVLRVDWCVGARA